MSVGVQFVAAGSSALGTAVEAVAVVGAALLGAAVLGSRSVVTGAAVVVVDGGALVGVDGLGSLGRRSPPHAATTRATATQISRTTRRTHP